MMKRTSKPLISVVIPTLGNSPHLRGLLERLQRQRFTLPGVASSGFEVLVVANLPRQDLRQLVSSMNRTGEAVFEYLETGKLGVNLARNKGLDRAKADVVLFLDDDAILDDLGVESELFLNAHLQIHSSNQNLAAVGGPYRLVGNTTTWDEAYHTIAHRWLDRHIRSDGRTTQLLGGNLSLKKSILDRHRIEFDEKVPFGGAETGLCQRLALASEVLVFRQTLVIGHAPNLKMKAFCRKAYLQGAGARWRERTVTDLPFTYACNVRTDAPAAGSSSVLRAMRLYEKCFEFGWQRDPFKKTLVGGSTYELNVAAFLYHQVYRWLFKKIPVAIRARRRALYCSIRSIWMSAVS